MKKILSCVVVSFALFIQQVEACTRVVYHGLNGLNITARSMDWDAEIPANLWVLPRGIERTGMASHSTLHWKSKYGSVVTTSWNISSTDGMNEKGLVANILWLAESQYPTFSGKGDKKTLAISIWLQYVLDNFATVSEAVHEFQKNEISVVSANIPGSNTFAALHLAISDASGDNAIFEYINGRLNIYHDPSYVTLTNSPSFEQQLVISRYWNGVPGELSLPGSNRGADRFARASYYIQQIPKVDDPKIALPSVLSVLRSTSVPFGVVSKKEPDASSTRWRTLADQKNLVYYFENVLNPNIISVDFSKIDFSEKGKVKKLTLENNENYSGETSSNFQVAKPFDFLFIP